MKNNVFILLFLMTTILMAACGGAGDTGSRNEENQQSETNAEKISGVWSSGQFKGPTFDERFFSEGQYYDEQFTVIKSTGIIINYDYAGDSYNRGGNCYIKKEGVIRALSNNEFEITYQGEDAFTRDIKVVAALGALDAPGIGVELVYTNLSSGESEVFPDAIVLESYFSPLCDE